MLKLTAEAKVGLLVLAGSVFLLWMTFAVGKFEFGEKKGYVVITVFDSVAGLDEKAAVRMAGVKIGTVEKVELVDSRARLILRIAPGVRIGRGAQAMIKTLGLLGEKYVEIIPAPPSERSSLDRSDAGAIQNGEEISVTVSPSGRSRRYLHLSLPAEREPSEIPEPQGHRPDRTASAGSPAGREFKVRQTWVGFDGMPLLLREAVRLAEDARFYEHEGIDYEAMNEAVKKNLVQLRWARGASTITQQLAKNLYLSTEKSLIRKLKEYFLAVRLEEDLTKNRIFHLYLNVIEFGPGIFGVEAAARHYFGKSIGQLNLEEIVRLTAVIPKPLVESPTRNSRWLKWRAGWLLSTLRKTGHISSDQYQQVAIRFK